MKKDKYLILDFKYLISVSLFSISFLYVQGVDSKEGLKEQRAKEKEWKEKKVQLEKAVFEGDSEKIKELIFYFADEQSIKNLNVILNVFSRIKDVSLYWSVIVLLSQKEDVYDEKARKHYFQVVTEYILKNRDRYGLDLMYVFYWRGTADLLSYVKRIYAKGSVGQKIFALEILKKFLGKKFLRTLLYLRFKKFPTIPKEEGHHTVYLTIRKLILEISNGVDFETLSLWEDFLKEKKNRKGLGKRRNVLGPAILKEEGKFETLSRGSKKILVINGQYDPQLSNVLKDMGIVHELKGSLSELDKKALEKADVIFIACGASLPAERGGASYTQSGSNKIKVATKQESVQELLRNFVLGGGYLFTEDLGIKDILERLFTGYVSAGESNQVGEYEIYPNVGFSTHPLLLDVFISPPVGGISSLKWKADMSPVYSINYDESKVSPIIYSPTFGENKILGVTFFYPGRENQGKFFLGKGYENIFFTKGGRVLYLTSHFGKQPKEASGFALQQLVLNFVYEARLRQKKDILLPEKKKGRR